MESPGGQILCLFSSLLNPRLAPLQLGGGWMQGQDGSRGTRGSWGGPGACGAERKGKFHEAVGRFGVGHVELELRGPAGHPLLLRLITNTWRPGCCLQ